MNRRKWWWVGLLGALAVAGAGLRPAAAAVSRREVAPSGASIAALARRERALLLQTGRVAAQAPAQAVTAVPKTVVNDPTGDMPFAAADITSAGFGQNSSGFVFSVNVAAPANPATDPNWLAGLAFASWAIDADADGSLDFLAMVIARAPGELVAGILGVGGPFECPGTGTYVPGVGIRAVFDDHACPLVMERFRFKAATSYTDDPNADNPPTDVAPDHGWSPTLPFMGGASSIGYWMLSRDGRVHSFGAATNLGSRTTDAVAIAASPFGAGYWVASRDGSVRGYGTERGFSGAARLRPGEEATSISAPPFGAGFWLFTNLGRVFPFGGARFLGDMAGRHLNRPVVGSAPTLTGDGYYMVAADGGVFAFGDAAFRGSMGGRHLNGRMVGMARSRDGRGYWLVGSDGGVFAFNAAFRGSMGGRHLNKPAVGIIAWGTGYLIVAADGGVFRFSDRAARGNLGAKPLPSPIVGATVMLDFRPGGPH